MSLRESSPENNLQKSIRRIDEIIRGTGSRPLSGQKLTEILEKHRTPTYDPSLEPNKVIKPFYRQRRFKRRI